MDMDTNLDEVPEPTDTNQGSKVPDSRDLSEAPPLFVYKAARRGKRKVKTPRQKENEIKSIVLEEVGLTANMVKTSLQNPNDKPILNKATPKRYSLVYHHYLHVFW